MNLPSAQRGQRNPVALLGAAAGLCSLILPWLTLRPNRLAAGEPTSVLDVAGAGVALLVFAIGTSAAAGLGLFPRHRYALWSLSGSLLLVASPIVAGLGASRLLPPGDTIARASLGSGVWLALLAAYVLLYAARSSRANTRGFGQVAVYAGPLVLLAALACGVFSDLSVMREFAINQQRFISECMRHIALALGSVALGACVAVPLGILAARSRRVEQPAFLVTSVIQTVPGLALFGLIMAPLAALSYAYPALRELGIRGVGTAPALLALLLYSLLPIMHNTYVGIQQVSAAALDAGRGMGMSRRQLSWRVEYPLAVPLVGEGIRTAAVQSVGNTTVAALIGAGGLGHFIFQGLGQAAPDLILLGALPVIGIALGTDLAMRALIHTLTPKGLRLEVTP